MMFHGKVKAIITKVSPSGSITQERIKLKVHFLSGGLIEVVLASADWMSFNLPDKLKVSPTTKRGCVIWTYNNLGFFEQEELKKHKKILSKEYLRIEYDEKWANHIEKRRAKSPPYKLCYNPAVGVINWWDYFLAPLIPFALLILAIWKFCAEETIK